MIANNGYEINNGLITKKKGRGRPRKETTLTMEVPQLLPKCKPEDNPFKVISTEKLKNEIHLVLDEIHQLQKNINLKKEELKTLTDRYINRKD